MIRIPILLFFVFFVFFVTLQAKDNINDLPLKVEQYHSLTKKNGVNIKYFQLKIDQKIPDEDITIMVRPVEDIGDPDIYISTTEPYPDSFSNSEIRCTTNGLDICVINDTSIADNSTFYIGNH